MLCLIYSGKSAFLQYQKYKLLLEGRPIIEFNKNSPVYYCSKGVYRLPKEEIDSDFLTAQDDPYVRDITILIDANDDPESRRIPLISSIRTEILGPTIIYTSSPDLRTVKKQTSETIDI